MTSLLCYCEGFHYSGSDKQPVGFINLAQLREYTQMLEVRFLPPEHGKERGSGRDNNKRKLSQILGQGDLNNQPDAFGTNT